MDMAFSYHIAQVKLTRTMARPSLNTNYSIHRKAKCDAQKILRATIMKSNQPISTADRTQHLQTLLRGTLVTKQSGVRHSG
jgi:hypothetical protein